MQGGVNLYNSVHWNYVEAGRLLQLGDGLRTSIDAGVIGHGGAFDVKIDAR